MSRSPKASYRRGGEAVYQLIVQPPTSRTCPGGDLIPPATLGGQPAPFFCSGVHDLVHFGSAALSLAKIADDVGGGGGPVSDFLQE